MAIKRVIYELDDAKDSNPITGATIQNLQRDKNFIDNQTQSVEKYKETEIPESSKIENAKHTFGRTIPDFIVEFKSDNRLMTVLITIISFIIFVTKIDSFADFLYPIALSVILNLLWYSIPIIEGKFKRS